MNIEITDLDMILNYLETTSLEPHDDYSSEFTYKEQKILYKYIKQLQQENKQLKDNWNKLKEWVNKHYDYYINNEDYIGGRLCFTDMKDKMQELEKSDNNE